MPGSLVRMLQISRSALYLCMGTIFGIQKADGVVMVLMTKDDEDCSGDAQAYSSHACGGIATSIVLDNA